MEADIVIIGAGIIGLSIGYELSKILDDIIIIEKESGFGKHTSSRNSEVIHSGIYYQKNSLKPCLCLQVPLENSWFENPKYHNALPNYYPIATSFDSGLAFDYNSLQYFDLSTNCNYFD